MRKTRHYKLPLFDSNDQPKWLVDWNEAMAKIDEAIHTAGSGDPDVPDISELYGMIQELQTLTDNIVNNLYAEYDNTRAYAKNDFCSHNGELYICTEETFVGDVFNPSNWSNTNITAKLTECINTFEKLLSTIGWIFDEDTNYSVNDFVWHNGEFYKFTHAYTAGEGWQDSYVLLTNLGAETSDLLNRVTVLEQGGESENIYEKEYPAGSFINTFLQPFATGEDRAEHVFPLSLYEKVELQSGVTAGSYYYFANVSENGKTKVTLGELLSGAGLSLDGVDVPIFLLIYPTSFPALFNSSPVSLSGGDFANSIYLKHDDIPYEQPSIGPMFPTNAFHLTSESLQNYTHQDGYPISMDIDLRSNDLVNGQIRTYSGTNYIGTFELRFGLINSYIDQYLYPNPRVNTYGIVNKAYSIYLHQVLDPSTYEPTGQYSSAYLLPPDPNLEIETDIRTDSTNPEQSFYTLPSIDYIGVKGGANMTNSAQGNLALHFRVYKLRNQYKDIVLPDIKKISQ